MLKEILLAGLGFMVLTKEKAETIVQELIRKGEISREEGKDFLNLLLKKAEQQRDRFMTQVDEKVKETLKAMDIVTKADYDELSKKIQQLEEKVKLMENLGRQ